MDINSKWRRDAKTSSALRLGDKTYLVLMDQGWVATHKGKAHDIPAPLTPNALEEAIVLTDAFFTPAQWKFEEGQWLRDGWLVRAEQTGWYVYRTDGEDLDRASVQEFASADRARRWAEVRFDRTGTNLRGPKPRAGRKSTSKLPDVRVTEAEKATAMDLLKDLGLTYSQFVRASLRFARENIDQYPLEEDDWCIVKDDNGAPRFVRALDLNKEQLDHIRSNSSMGKSLARASKNLKEIKEADIRGSERSEELLPSAPGPQTPDQTPDQTPSPSESLATNPFMHVKGLWPTGVKSD